MVKVKEITNTCGACPAQWEGLTVNNEPIYVRYRWGYLSIRIGPQNSDIMEAVGGKKIFGKQIDKNGWDGQLSYSQLKYYTKKVIVFPRKENN